MTESRNSTNASTPSRRDFLKSSAALGAAAFLAPLPKANFFVGGSDKLKVGAIGCGGRGSGAIADILQAVPGKVEIVALADAFKDRIDGCRGWLKEEHEITIPEDRCFVGLDAYKALLATDVDLVILATSPGFRPLHIEAAAAAGKHIFAEKPVAVCPAGVRKVLAAGKLMEEKGLAFVTGTQRRHQASYIETMKRIHEGAVGDITGGSVYWHQGGLWSHQKRAEWSAAEWQMRNWLYFVWLSGDHIVEQHVHNIDVMNWVMGGPPVKAFGMGGRQVRTDPVYGHIFDHFYIEYEFRNGVKIHSSCRQIDGCESRVEEMFFGTKGRTNGAGRIDGETKWRYEGDNPNPYVIEHKDLVESILAGKPLNESKRIAESTLTAIMGRMSAYTGKLVTFDFAMQSQLDTFPKDLTFGDLSVPPVAVPGRTPLV
jgi:predicted dehydrogenase